jgi:hypothetical protein
VPWPVALAAWPYGAERPGEASTAAVLGFCLAFPVGAGGLLGLLSLISTGDSFSLALALALPSAAGLVVGSTRLLRRRGRALLAASAAATAAVLIALSLADPELRSDGWAGVLAGALVWLPLPVVTAWFAALPRVGDWVADRPLPVDAPLPYAPPPRGWPPELWPYGPPRPRPANVAVVLALVTAGCTFWIAPFGIAISMADSAASASEQALLLLLPCAAGMLAGGLRLLHRRSRGLLLGSSLAAVILLLGVLVADLVADPDEWVDQLVWALFVLPLPVLTAWFTARRAVRNWLTAPAG